MPTLKLEEAIAGQNIEYIAWGQKFMASAGIKTIFLLYHCRLGFGQIRISHSRPGWDWAAYATQH